MFGEPTANAHRQTQGFAEPLTTSLPGTQDQVLASDIVGRVMNPFFTTKPKGEGTGLGLSISQDLVRKNAGAMSIESRFGQFTSVNIDLPEITM